MAGFEALFEVDVEARRVGESLEFDVEAGGIEAVIVFFSLCEDISVTEGVLLVEMFAMASMRRILKNPASSTSL